MPITHVVKRSGAIVPFNEERIANAIYRAAVAVGGRDRDRANWLAKEVVNLLVSNSGEGYIPSIEDIQDAVEKVLIENGHAAVAKAFILYRDEAARRRESEARHAAHPSENIPWAKLWHILDWAVEHQVHTIQALNDRLRKGEFAQIVHESETAYEDDVAGAAQQLAENEKIRLVLVCGPSSSGKTTTTIKLEQSLQTRGAQFKVLNLDHYFYNLEDHPKDEFGDYDYETPQALDLKLINNHLLQLLDGKEVLIPYYDFKTGTRVLDQTPLKLDSNEVLLIDSLHGLFPPMTSGVADEMKYKLYLEPFLQMKDTEGRYVRWTDLRLMRRMLRDAVHRAWNPQQTLEHWHYVRASEKRNIIPYMGTADFVVNTAMPYELALYRPRLMNNFETWKNQYKDDPLRQDAYLRAARIYPLLSNMIGIEDDSPIPSTSVIREFIGGSSLSY